MKWIASIVLAGGSEAIGTGAPATLAGGAGGGASGWASGSGTGDVGLDNKFFRERKLLAFQIEASSWYRTESKTVYGFLDPFAIRFRTIVWISN